VEIAARVEFFQVRLFRRRHPDVGQSEIGGERIAVGERLPEMLAGVDEDDRQRGIDAGDHVEEHGGFRAERGDGGDPAREPLADRALDDPLRGEMAPERVEGRRLQPFGLRRRGIRRHRGPP